MTHTMTHTKQDTPVATYIARHAVALEAYTEALKALNADPFAQAPTPGGFFPVWDNLVIAQREYQVALHNKLWAESN